MKNLKRSLSYLFVAVFAMLFVGCSSKSIYTVEPTPIKKGEAKYVIEEFKLTLSHGHGRNLENKTFKNEDELKDSFAEFINKKLKEQKLDGTNVDDSYKVKIDMNYERKYNIGGNALNKPYIDYSVKVFDKNNKLLVSYGYGKHTTKYAYFEDVAVNAEIALFKWDAEDEPRDVELISGLIVKDLAELGK